MAKTNAKGFFCDYPCGFSQSKCQLFFCAGCASAGMPLSPNTEYPEYSKISSNSIKKETAKK